MSSHPQLLLTCLSLLIVTSLSAQTAPPPTGKVLFSTDALAAQSRLADTPPAIPVTNTERAAFQITAYHLDLHLTPAAALLEARVTLTLKNTTGHPVTRIPLQLSSTLRWQTLSFPFTQSPIATDADHTGYAQEVVLTPPVPLAAGESLTVTGFYSGPIHASAARLELLGTPPEQAEQADWDQIAPTTDTASTALRGFGNVLWYPVAAPTAALGEGNQFFDLIQRQRAAAVSTIFRARLAVDYLGDPPAAAILNGRLLPLTALPDTTDDTVAETHGTATAELAPQLLGLRLPSLFLTAQQPATDTAQALAIITPNSDALAPYTEAAGKLQPLLAAWFGPTPLQPALLLDHAGDPFEDHTFLAGQLATDAQPQSIAPTLVGVLSHAELLSIHPWIDEGLPRFMSLLWTERTQGREAALKQLAENSAAIAFAEPDLSQASNQPGGQPLIEATSDVFYRRKAAAVWWQLREILGEPTLQQALIAYRHSESLSATFDADPKAMQHTLERVAKRDLAWFFDDWVNRDRSLPDLTILNVAPRPLPARSGRSGGFLVAVEVRNDGDAVAEVPVTVHSATLAASDRLRIPAHSTVSTRIVFEDTPESVQVNDGSVPELRSSLHTRQITPAQD